ncbi:MAG: helix-turn-helix domain-containing protein [Candidatus Sulfotelmatobacter sp.]
MPALRVANAVAPTQPTVSDKVLLTREECADILRIHIRTLDALLKDGILRFKRVGKPLRGRVLVPRVEIERFLQVDQPAKRRVR